MNYEDMSDLELNKLMAVKLGFEFPSKPKEPYSSISGNVIFNNGCDGRDSRPYFPDYCTDWNATMPLAVEYGLKIDPRRTSPKLGYMVSESDLTYSVDKNPLRAIVICLIKVLKAKVGAQ